MPSIFDDECADHGQIRANPFGTWRISSLDVAVKCLKWPALLRISRLAKNEMRHAGTLVKSSPRP